MGRSETIGMSCSTEIEPEYNLLLQDSKNIAFLLVAVRYRDIFGAIYFISLCYILDNDNHRFVLTGDGAPLNEWRKEKGSRSRRMMRPMPPAGTSRFT